MFVHGIHCSAGYESDKIRKGELQYFCLPHGASVWPLSLLFLDGYFLCVLHRMLPSPQWQVAIFTVPFTRVTRSNLNQYDYQLWQHSTSHVINPIYATPKFNTRLPHLYLTLSISSLLLHYSLTESHHNTPLPPTLTKHTLPSPHLITSPLPLALTGPHDTGRSNQCLHRGYVLPDISKRETPQRVL